MGDRCNGQPTSGTRNTTDIKHSLSSKNKDLQMNGFSPAVGGDEGNNLVNGSSVTSFSCMIVAYD